MQHNPRLTKDKETFKTIMSSKFILLIMLKYSSAHKMTAVFALTDLNLSYPKMIDVAVPANMVCGLQDVPSQAN